MWANRRLVKKGYMKENPGRFSSSGGCVFEEQLALPYIGSPESNLAVLFCKSCFSSSTVSCRIQSITSLLKSR